MLMTRRYSEVVGPPVWTRSSWEAYPEELQKKEWEEFYKLQGEIKGE